MSWDRRSHLKMFFNHKLFIKCVHMIIDSHTSMMKAIIPNSPPDSSTSTISYKPRGGICRISGRSRRNFLFALQVSLRPDSRFWFHSSISTMTEWKSNFINYNPNGLSRHVWSSSLKRTLKMPMILVLHKTKWGRFEKDIRVEKIPLCSVPAAVYLIG